MRLAALNLTAGTVTPLYTCPASRRAILSVNLCNRTSGTAKIRIAMTTGGAPVDADWIEYDTPLPAAGSPGGSVAQVTGLALGAGQAIYVVSDATNVSAVAYGIVETV